MLKDYFIGIVKNAVLKAIENNELGETKEINFELICDKPKNKDFGDFAINISALSKTARMAPAVIAQTIVKYIQQENFSINVVQGFINFKLENKFLNEIILQILNKKENYLKTNIGNNKKVNIEYVSANPTGPFHIGHGRWAALGSAVANIMKYLNFDKYLLYLNSDVPVIFDFEKSREYYVKCVIAPIVQ